MNIEIVHDVIPITQNITGKKWKLLHSFLDYSDYIGISGKIFSDSDIIKRKKENEIKFLKKMIKTAEDKLKELV